MFLKKFFDKRISTEKGVVVLVAIALLLGMLLIMMGREEELGRNAEASYIDYGVENSFADNKEEAYGKAPSGLDIEDSYRISSGSAFRITNRLPSFTSFQETSNSVISVDISGKVTGKDPGVAYVLAEADSDGGLAKERKLVKITVYPDELKAPKVKKKEKSEHIVLSWNKVKYAGKYELLEYVGSGYRRVLVTRKRSVEVPYGKARYAVRALVTLDTGTIKGKRSKDIKISSIVDSMASYNSIHEIAELGEDDLELVAEIEGDGSARIPQSFCYTGEKYLITFVDTGGGNGTLVSYDDEGNRGSERKVDMGHVNGSTYKKDTNRIYTVVTHRQHRSDDCEAYDLDDLDKTTFELPRITSGIAYDSSNDRFYLSGGPKIMVTGTDFQSDKVVMKKRYHQAQDIGAYDGAALIAVWHGGDRSYVDMYRVSDDSYLGTYSLPFGEIESVTAVDGHLVVLMHSARFRGKTGDFILRSKSLIGK